MSLPASARHRWGLADGGVVGFLDLGDCVLLVPGAISELRAEVFGAITPDDWAAASAGFGDPDLANQ